MRGCRKNSSWRSCLPEAQWGSFSSGAWLSPLKNAWQRPPILFWPGQAREVVMTVITTTGTVTVNAAFLQEIKEVNQELWSLLADLRHRCQRPIAPGHCRLLIDKLCQLRDQLALHFSLEEAYGYFEDPVEVAPQLSRQAEMLRSEHRSCISTSVTSWSGPSGCSTTSSMPRSPCGSAQSFSNSISGCGTTRSARTS